MQGPKVFKRSLLELDAQAIKREAVAVLDKSLGGKRREPLNPHAVAIISRTIEVACQECWDLDSRQSEANADFPSPRRWALRWMQSWCLPRGLCGRLNSNHF